MAEQKRVYDIFQYLPRAYVLDCEKRSSFV